MGTSGNFDVMTQLHWCLFPKGKSEAPDRSEAGHMGNMVPARSVSVRMGGVDRCRRCFGDIGILSEVYGGHSESWTGDISLIKAQCGCFKFERLSFVVICGFGLRLSEDLRSRIRRTTIQSAQQLHALILIDFCGR